MLLLCCTCSKQLETVRHNNCQLLPATLLISMAAAATCKYHADPAHALLVQVLYMWDRLESHKIKADGTSEAVFVQGISELVGRGELKHVVVEGAGRQEGGSLEGKEVNRYVCGNFTCGKGCTAAKKMGFSPCAEKGDALGQLYQGRTGGMATEG